MNDGAGNYYDATTAKFISAKFGQTVNSTKDGVNTATPYTPYDFGSETAFKQRVDNSMAGLMRDCGECHVGGGAMEYVPRNASEGTNPDFRKPGGFLQDADRVPYRSATYNSLVSGQYTAFNYFVDVFDENKDNDTEQVLAQDFTQTGVLEMDCFACHLQGYSWQARKDAVRKGAFDGSRVTGAGLGSVLYNTTTGAPGRSVSYDTTKVVDDGSGNLQLASDFANLIAGTPPAENCASCHQGHHQVDWKKRGEMDPSLDVHANIGCMGCHQRKDIVADDSTPGDGTVGNSGAAKESKLALCDPAKGKVGPWDNLANKVDNVGFKTCADCHLSDGDLGSFGKDYNAPNPANAHKVAGLSDLKLQTGRDGSATVSHLDIIACTSCHIKKDGVTGGAFVDGTGPDHEGRLADHDNQYVERDMAGKYGFNWANDKKIHPGNFLTSFFLRDKNDRGYDVNADGRKGGMDAVLQTHVASVLYNSTAIDHGIFYDGTVTASEVGSHISEHNRLLPKFNGQTPDANGSMVKLSFLMVPFTMSHQIAPATEAFGAGGCTDCHGDNAGFYNGTVDMQGKSQISWNKAQTTPMTKVNGKKDASFTHPKVRDKWLARSIPLMLNNGDPADTAQGDAGLRNPDRSEILYEDTFKKRDTTWHTSAITGYNTISIPSPSGPKSTKGWLLKVETCPSTADCSDPANITARTAAFGANTAATDLESLLANGKLNNPGFLDGTFGFTVSAPEPNQISITPDGSTKIRIHPQTVSGPLKLYDAVYTNAPIKPTQGALYNSIDADGVINGRGEMINYLNAIGATPAPAIKSIDGNTAENVDADGDGTNDAFGVTLDTTVTLEADTTTAGPFEYTWSCTDGGANVTGATADRTFDVAGTYSLRLAVENTLTGAVETTYVKVKVQAAEVDSTGLTLGSASTTDGVTTISVDATPSGTSRLAVIWGDGGRDVYDSVPTSVSHSYYGSKSSYDAEFRAINATTGELLAKAVVTVSGYPGGGDPVTQTVAITEPVEGSVTNIDQIRLVGTRSAGTNIVVTSDSTNVNIGSVYYVDGDWYCDVYYTAADTAVFTATTDDGTASDTVTVEYKPVDGSTLGVPYDITYTEVDHNSVTVTGKYSGGYNSVNLYIDYPSEARVGEVLYNSSGGTEYIYNSLTDAADADGTGFEVTIDNLYNSPAVNYATAKEEDVAGNEGTGTSFAIEINQ